MTIQTPIEWYSSSTQFTSCTFFQNTHEHTHTNIHLIRCIYSCLSLVHCFYFFFSCIDITITNEHSFFYEHRFSFTFKIVNKIGGVQSAQCTHIAISNMVTDSIFKWFIATLNFNFNSGIMTECNINLASCKTIYLIIIKQKKKKLNCWLGTTDRSKLIMCVQWNRNLPYVDNCDVINQIRSFSLEYILSSTLSVHYSTNEIDFHSLLFWLLLLLLVKFYNSLYFYFSFQSFLTNINLVFFFQLPTNTYLDTACID